MPKKAPMPKKLKTKVPMTSIKTICLPTDVRLSFWCLLNTFELITAAKKTNSPATTAL